MLHATRLREWPKQKRVATTNVDGGCAEAKHAGDFDGDGNVELLVPSCDRQSLVALCRSEDGITEVWQLSLSSPLATNLAAVEIQDGVENRIGLGVVTTDGQLLIWQ